LAGSGPRPKGGNKRDGGLTRGAKRLGLRPNRSFRARTLASRREAKPPLTTASVFEPVAPAQLACRVVAAEGFQRIRSDASRVGGPAMTRPERLLVGRQGGLTQRGRLRSSAGC